MEQATRLSEDVLTRIKEIQFRARFLVTDIFAGGYESAFKGRGMEFQEVREYQPGDDVRKIDWNVTARQGYPFMKEFREERELTVFFLIDVSASSLFGSQDKLKSDMQAELAAFLAYCALRNNDKIGLILFSDQIEHYLPPKKSRGHIWQVIRDILTYRGESRKTDLSIALELLSHVAKRKVVAFLISDFIATGYEQTIRPTAKRHDLVAVRMSDPREAKMPEVGLVDFVDAETGMPILVDTSSSMLQQSFVEGWQRDRAEQNALFGSAGIDLIDVQTDRSFVDPVRLYFRQRSLRR